eukprot:14952287-Ditylum_brightwellii.AAC.1
MTIVSVRIQSIWEYMCTYVCSENPQGNTSCRDSILYQRDIILSGPLKIIQKGPALVNTTGYQLLRNQSTSPWSMVMYVLTDLSKFSAVSGGAVY